MRKLSLRYQYRFYEKTFPFFAPWFEPQATHENSTEHYTIHIGEKNPEENLYTCEFCGEYFSQSFIFDTHKRNYCNSSRIISRYSMTAMQSILSKTTHKYKIE